MDRRLETLALYYQRIATIRDVKVAMYPVITLVRYKSLPAWRWRVYRKYYIPKLTWHGKRNDVTDVTRYRAGSMETYSIAVRAAQQEFDKHYGR